MASRTRLALLGAILTLIAGTSAAVAQDTTRGALPDSLAARLSKAEEAIELLRQQLSAQASASVQSRSRASLEFSGRIIANAFFNKGRANNFDVPQVAVVQAAGYQDRSAGGTLRQTMLSLSAQGGKLWGADASAYLETDFFGGQQNAPGDRPDFPEPRIRIARATLRWANAELMVGQDVPLITPVEPVSTASTGFPTFVRAGNLWFWLTQVRGTIETSGNVRWGLQAALLAPWSGGDVIAGDADGGDLGERQRLPQVEMRVRARWGEEEMRGEIGLGVHQAWLGTAADTTISSRAIALTALLPLTSWLEFRAEAYSGQALRGLGGGGVGQNIGAAGAPIRDVGGWFQLNVKPSATWMVGAGCGMSHPEAADQPARLKNDVCELHTLWRPGGLPFVGIEYREFQTTYPVVGLQRLRHMNIGVGVEF